MWSAVRTVRMLVSVVVACVLLLAAGCASQEPDGSTSSTVGSTPGSTSGSTPGSLGLDAWLDLGLDAWLDLGLDDRHYRRRRHPGGHDRRGGTAHPLGDEVLA